MAASQHRLLTGAQAQSMSRVRVATPDPLESFVSAERMCLDQILVPTARLSGRVQCPSWQRPYGHVRNTLEYHGDTHRDAKECREERVEHKRDRCPTGQVQEGQEPDLHG